MVLIYFLIFNVVNYMIAIMVIIVIIFIINCDKVSIFTKVITLFLILNGYDIKRYNFKYYIKLLLI